MRTTVTLIAFVVLFFGPILTAEAAPARFFGPVVSDACYCETETVGADGTKTNTSAPDWGCVLQTAQNGMNLVISLGIILGVIYLVYAGFMFVTSATNPGNRQAARSQLLNVLVGFIVVLGAWLIVDFVMKTLYDQTSSSGKVTLGPWNAILEGNADDICLKPVKAGPPLPGVTAGGLNTTGGVAVNPNAGATPSTTPATPATPATNAPGTLTHAEALKRLQAAGISISSSGNCSDKSNSKCTSLEGIRVNTLEQVIAVKKGCGCPVTVTGGTEVGHASGTYSHGKGYKIDLRLSDQLTSYFQSMTRSGSRGSDPRYLDRCGNEYVREGSPKHWDVTAIKGICSPPK